MRGGAFYGQLPDLADRRPRRRRATNGAWIPTTSFDQYGATLARWFGVPTAALAQVFPNLGAFASQDLGFLG